MIAFVRVRRALYAAVLTMAALSVAGPALADAGPWIGPDGAPLPFTDHEQLLTFLAEAPVVASKALSTGINHARKLTLSRDGVTAHAIFRTVDVDRRDPGGRRIATFRDCYLYEAAAYQLSRLLGLDHVPPATLRTLDGTRGSIQLWIENAHSEADRIEQGGALVSPAAWQMQRQMLVIFDNLIYNFDRNHGNVLHDARGKVWFVDHTRSFKRLPTLPAPAAIVVCERALFEHLKALDAETVTARLAPYLHPLEIDALLKRHRLLLQLIEDQVAKRGSAVFYRFDGTRAG